MRIAVFGTGGAGGYFGGRLAQSGEAVTFIARGEHLRAIREHGLRVESVKGDFAIHPAQATDDPAEVGPADFVILGVKTWQVNEAAQAMRPLIGPETAVVPLQNGVEAHEQIAAEIGRQHVLGGLASIISFITGPGHIRHTGGPASIAFAELDNRPSERTERLLQALLRAGINASIPPDIQAALWEKFLFVVPVGGLGAVTRAPIGVMRSIPETRQMLEQGMQEIQAVGQAHEVDMPEAVFARTWALIEGLPPGGTASLQRDINSGRPSELEAWNGAVVRLGQSVGVRTPLHAFIYHSLLPLEKRARGQIRFE
jgi:2-dehydropantoate 2-reductase